MSGDLTPGVERIERQIDAEVARRGRTGLALAAPVLAVEMHHRHAVDFTATDVDLLAHGFRCDAM